MRIRIKLRKKTSFRVNKRLKNKARIRKGVHGTAERPRLAIYRSGRHTYAQIIDDVTGKTLAFSSTLKMSTNGNNKEAAKLVGEDIAKRALEKNLKSVVFDRSGYIYHGRVQVLAEAAREAGLQF